MPVLYLLLTSYLVAPWLSLPRVNFLTHTTAMPSAVREATIVSFTSMKSMPWLLQSAKPAPLSQPSSNSAAIVPSAATIGNLLAALVRPQFHCQYSTGCPRSLPFPPPPTTNCSQPTAFISGGNWNFARISTTKQNWLDIAILNHIWKKRIWGYAGT